MDARDPRFQRAVRSDGRPAFGLGPISRVPPMAAAPGQGPGPSGDAAAGPGPSGASSSSAVAVGVGSRGMGTRPGADLARARAFGLPNLRRNVCPHFFMTGARGAIPIHAPHLLKALVRQDATTSRCQLRGGVHLEQGYVNDVCLSPRFNQCVFYEEDLTDR